ncbi:MAG: hypothetical protein FWG66_11075 [Spirochaetes bacterium]|nr:hypothetical protein [Spirochaetota bacterium]
MEAALILKHIRLPKRTLKRLGLLEKANPHHDVLGRFTFAPDTGGGGGGGGGTEPAGFSAAVRNIKTLSGILESGKSQIVKSKELGDVTVDKGKTGNDGYGLLHIIERRIERDKLNSTEITSLIYKVNDAIENGYKTDTIDIKGGRIGLEKDGIIAILDRKKEGGKDIFMVSGYMLDKKKEEAANAIKTVSADYGYTPEFSGFRKQVEAAISSLPLSSHKPVKKSIQNKGGANMKLEILKWMARAGKKKKAPLATWKGIEKALGRGGEGAKLEYFKKKILAHLRGLPEGDVKKAYNPGTIRTWKGKKHIKGADKKWRPYYDKESRGANAAIKSLMRKVSAAESAEALLQLVKLHRDRFSDADGRPLPIVQELSRHVREKGDALDKQPESKKQETSRKAKEKRATEKEKKKSRELSLKVTMGKYERGEITASDAFLIMRQKGASADEAREAFGLKPNGPGSFKDAMMNELGIDIDKKGDEAKQAAKKQDDINPSPNKKEFEVNGKKVVVENGAVSINGKLAHKGVRASSITEINDLPQRFKDQLKSMKDFDPTGRVALSGGEFSIVTVPREIAEEAARQTEKIQAAADPEKHIEGYKEIKAAYADAARYRREYRRVEDDDVVRLPKPVAAKPEDVEKKYPRAAAYIKMEEWADSNPATDTGFAKRQAGKKAVKRLIAGDDMDEVLAEAQAALKLGIDEFLRKD